MPLAILLSLSTVVNTPAACSPPITLILAFGHIHKKRGLNRVRNGNVLKEPVSTSAHSVVSSSEASTDNNGELGYVRVGDSTNLISSDMHQSI